ncbi:MAG TPA: hypothetical protein VL048_02710 [Xanthobacteraceae bacterium]|nr:hypothetical protein [Xanthobacteraceae bacterium]
MDYTIDKKSVESLGAKLDQLHKSLNDNEKVLLASVLKGSAGHGVGKLPSEVIKDFSGKLQLGADLVTIPT